MIDALTITLNPAIDLTISVPRLTPGDVHRAQSAESNVGGKGINVAGCLADWGVGTAVTGFLGIANDRPFRLFFAEKKLEDQFLRVAGETRTNIKISDTERDQTTDINLPGLIVDEIDLDKLMTRIEEIARPAMPVVIAGSLPKGAPPAFLVEMTARLRRIGARVVLDTSGPALSEALAAPVAALPHLVKPNRREMELWVGQSLGSVADLAAASRDLVGRGIPLVAVSLGEEGAILTDDSGSRLARLPPIKTQSSVGAGDAMVAGLVSGLVDNLNAEMIARRAVAFATAKLGRIGPHLPPRAEVRRLATGVTLTDLRHAA